MANDKAPAKNPKKTLTEAEKAKRDKEQGENFVKLVNKRMTKVLAANTILKRMANTRNYKFTTEQVDKIEQAMKASSDATVKAFRDALKGGGAAAGVPSFDVTK